MFKHAVKSVIAFTILGPMAGNVAYVVLILALGLFGGADELGVSVVAIMLLWGGWGLAFWFGTLPAFITGALFTMLVYGVPPLHRAHRAARGLAAAMVGAPVTVAVFAWLNAEGRVGGNWTYALIGAVAAFVVGIYWPRQARRSSDKCTQPAREVARG